MLRGLFAGVGLVALSTGAYAQAPKANEGGIEEIVVTAQRREESAQRTALAVQALSGEALTRGGIARPEDLGTLATGVSVSSGGNVPQVYIRGVGNYSTNVYAEGAAAFNVDNVYISRQWATRGNFFDLDRIEILKGPQGTLYGRNASGGAINILSVRPQLGEFGGFLEGEVGNYSLARGTGALNIPITDKFAMRAAGQIIRRDGYLDDGSEDERSQSGRLHMLYKPGGDFSLLVTGAYQHLGGRGAGNTPVPPLPGSPWRGLADAQVNAIYAANPFVPGPPGFLFLQAQPDSFVKSDVYSISTELNWDFGPATLTLIPSYRYGEHSDRFYVSTFQLTEAEYDRQLTVEARLSNQTDRLKWVAGVYYFDEHQGNLDGQSLLKSNAGFNGQVTTPFNSNTTSYAAFGQATYSIIPTFRLTAGLRYTYERKTQGGHTVSYNGSATPPPPVTCAPGNVIDFTSPIPFGPCRKDIELAGLAKFYNLSYKAGFEYDIAERSMLYFNYSTGFKSGGFWFAPPPNTFRPEKLNAWELGVKNRFLNNRLQLNFEAFYWRYINHQESHLGPTSVAGYFTFITENAGSAKSYGLSMDLVYEPTDADRFSLGVQYNKSKYNSFQYTHPSGLFGPITVGCNVTPFPAVTQTIDCSGFQLVRAPTWTGNVAYDHTFALSGGATLTAGVSAQFSSGYYLSIDFLPIERQQAFYMLDSDLTYTAPNGKWSVSAWGRNLTETAAFSQSFRSPFISNNNPQSTIYGFAAGSIRSPRTFGIRARYNF